MNLMNPLTSRKFCIAYSTFPPMSVMSVIRVVRDKEQWREIVGMSEEHRFALEVCKIRGQVKWQ
jgi:hypothetical protein